MSQAVVSGIYYIHTAHEDGRETKAVTCPPQRGEPLYLEKPHEDSSDNQKWRVLPDGVIVSVIEPDAFASTTTPSLVGSPVAREPFPYPWEFIVSPDGVVIKSRETPLNWNPDDVNDVKTKVVLYPNPFKWRFIPVLE